MKSLFKKIALTTILATAIHGSAMAQNNELNIGIFYYSQSDSFISQIDSSLKNDFKALDIKVKSFDASNNLTTQITQIENYLATEPDVILVNPVDTQKAETAATISNKYNTPIIFFNRKPSGIALVANSNNYYVGPLPQEAGWLQAQIVEDYFSKNANADKNKDGKISYVLIQGTKDHQDTVGRNEGFELVINQGPFKGDKIATLNGEFSYAQAHTVMDQFILTKDLSKVEAIVCNNDDMALAALDVIRQKGYNLNDKSKYIPIVGVDALPKAVSEVSSGGLIGTVLNDSAKMSKVLRLVSQAVAEGKEINEALVDCKIDGRDIIIPYVKITK